MIQIEAHREEKKIEKKYIKLWDIFNQSNESHTHKKRRQIFFFLNLFIYLFMAVLGPRFCARAPPSRGKRGPLFIAVRGPLTIAASPAAEPRRLSNCGPRAQSLRGTWDPPRPGLEPVCPAPAGRFSTTAPPGKPGDKSFFEQIMTKSFPNLLKTINPQIQEAQ